MVLESFSLADGGEIASVMVVKADVGSDMVRKGDVWIYVLFLVSVVNSIGRTIVYEII